MLKVTVDDILSRAEVKALIDSYAAESKHEKTPDLKVDFSVYGKLESVGMFSVFAAFESGNVVGFITLAITPSPRFSVPVGMVEAFFVDQKYRKNGTGKKLLEEAERYAKANWAAGIMVSAPPDGRLVRALPTFGYTEINRIFYKGV